MPEIHLTHISLWILFVRWEHHAKQVRNTVCYYIKSFICAWHRKIIIKCSRMWIVQKSDGRWASFNTCRYSPSAFTSPLPPLKLFCWVPSTFRMGRQPCQESLTFYLCSSLRGSTKLAFQERSILWVALRLWLPPRSWRAVDLLIFQRLFQN